MLLTRGYHFSLEFINEPHTATRHMKKNIWATMRLSRNEEEGMKPSIQPKQHEKHMLFPSTPSVRHLDAATDPSCNEKST